MKTPTKRATRRLAASLAIATVLAASQSAWAGYWDWVGKGAGETSYFDDYGTPASKKINGCWFLSLNNGESANFSNYNHNFSNAGGTRPTYNPGWDNIVTFRELTSMTGAINLEAAGTITFVAKDQNSAYGIDSTNLLKLNPGANLAITSGTYSFSQIKVANDSTAGKSSTLTVNGSGASLAASGELSIGHSGSGGSEGHLVVGSGATVRAGGNFALNKGDVKVNGGNVTAGDILHIAYRGSGVFTLNDGTVDVATKVYFGGYYASDPTKLYLNGGTLSTPTIEWFNGNTTAGVVFNGGTLKANSSGTLIENDSNIAVSVGDGGGTIDNGGYDVSIPKTIGGAGVMHFTGSGTTTLSGARTVLDSEYVVDGGTLYFPEDTYIGESGGTPATFTVNGGTLEIDGGKWLRVYKKGVINLNGGTFKTKHIETQGGAVVNFKGGTLQANGLDTDNGGLIKAGATVNVNGGTIDSGNLAISIGAALGGTGGLTFTGGNTITLNGSVNYSGATAVTPGTTLAIANSTAKTNILGTHGLVVVGVPEAGQTIVTYTSALTASDYAKVSCSLAPTTTFKIGEDGQSIVVDEVGPTLDNYWTGAANDGDLSNAANWSAGNVPTTGNANIYCTTNSTLTKGETFAPTSITFIGGSAEATINGDFSGITQIANNSSSRVEFTGAVAFAGNVDVLQNTGIVKFTGGATGTWLARAMDLHGTYTFTGTGDRIELAGTTVKSDGVYNLPNATFYKHLGDFSVEAGGIAVVKSTKEDGGANNSYVYLANSIAGTFIATDEIYSERKPDGRNLLGGTGGAYLEKSSGDGVFFANKVRVASAGLLIAPKKIAIGPGGILRGAGIVRVVNNGSHYFGSLADWTMYKDGEADSADPIFIKYNSTSTSCVLTFDTRNYTNDAAQVITCKAPICAVNAGTASTLSAIVKGNGTFSFECSYNDTGTPKWFSGGLTVQDTATVEVKANAKPGKGAITLGAGTTLALTATGNTFTPLANTLNLPTGENEVATIRIDGTRLKGGVDHEIATVGNAASVTKDNVKIEGDAIGGRKTKLRIEDGKLLLKIPECLMVIIW